MPCLICASQNYEKGMVTGESGQVYCKQCFDEYITVIHNAVKIYCTYRRGKANQDQTALVDLLLGRGNCKQEVIK